MKEINIRKKAEKTKAMQDELADLESLKSLSGKELTEELEVRKLDSASFEKKIRVL